MAVPQGRPELILGTAQLRVAYGIARRLDTPPTPEHAQALLAAAALGGIDAIDTAPSYGDAEATIGRAAIDVPIHTKIDPAVPPAESLRASLSRLRRGRVEVLYVHDPAEVRRPSSTVLPEAHELVGSLVGRLGASVYDVEEFDAAAVDPRIGAVQIPLNILDRRIDDERLAEAARAGLHVYVRSVLLLGVLGAP
jgi:aryl-alcohol dehydrogenase-like predicted oxidoreductase